MGEFCVFLGVDGRRRCVRLDDIFLIEDVDFSKLEADAATQAIVTLSNGHQFIVENDAKSLLLAIQAQAGSQN